MDILIVEDDRTLAEDVATILSNTGYRPTVAMTLAAARAHLVQHNPRVIILDRRLPDGDGIELIPPLADSHPAAAVLVLSALAELEERVGGLHAGADDYLGKPYAEEELLARVAALARRRSQVGTTLHYGGLVLDRLARTARIDGQKLRLSTREFSLLEYFLLHAEETITRTMILHDVWGYDFDPGTNVIEVQVSKLRTKLAEHGAGDALATVRGAGYRLGNQREP